MNLSRRSLLSSLIAAPAVIAADRLMPVRLWVPTIYGDAIHDDWEGVSAWAKGERFNILPAAPPLTRTPIFPHHGVIVLGKEKIDRITSVYYESRKPKNALFEKLHF